MEGQRIVGELPPHLRTYRLLKLGLTLTEATESGPTGDWLIAIDNTYAEHAAARRDPPSV